MTPIKRGTARRLGLRRPDRLVLVRVARSIPIPRWMVEGGTP
jgi:hypothetical protein